VICDITTSYQHLSGQWQSSSPCVNCLNTPYRQSSEIHIIYAVVHQNVLLLLPRNALKCICAVLGSHVVRPSVRLSVRLSVTLVDCDHIGWKSRKLIARTISRTPSLLVAERRSIYSQGNMEKFGGDLRWG